ncbi:hypothetical protein D1BOALGB6SA_9858 [Olavius sp. associated proteobacterium Delta 1]|nr:hypothetical protein D1BOALGB6SA_9858 [Olavius sp. associated proteobacterium Delta 1]
MDSKVIDLSMLTTQLLMHNFFPHIYIRSEYFTPTVLSVCY